MLELNRLYCIDAFDGLARLPDKSIDLILTSPPFKDSDVGAGPNTSNASVKNPDNGEAYYLWLDRVVSELRRVTSIVVMFNSSIRLIDICKRYEPTRILIWNKKGCRMNYRYEPIFIFADHGQKINKGIWSDCISVNAIFNQTTPYQNPLKLYVQLLRYFPKAKSVLDPFMGSGTTLVAAKQLGLSFIGFEKESDRVDVANKRLRQESLSSIPPTPKGDGYP